MLDGARAQVWSYAPEYRRPRHFHAEPELNLLVAGSATFSIGDATVRAVAGDLLRFSPGQDHALCGASADLVLFAVGVSPALSREVLGLGEADALAAPERAQLTPGELSALVRRASTVSGQRGLESMVAELWAAAHAARRSGRSSGRGRHALTRRALAGLQQNPALDRAELARISRACPSELSRHLHQDLGLTLLQYRTRVRLMRAIQLVDERALNLTAAALDAGFGSYSQFHRAFQATIGCAPRHFFETDARARLEEAFEPAEDAESVNPTRGGSGRAGVATISAQYGGAEKPEL